MKGWLRDVEMEQCEQRSHKAATNLVRGGIAGGVWCATAGGGKWKTAYDRKVKTCKRGRAYRKSTQSEKLIKIFFYLF